MRRMYFLSILSLFVLVLALAITASAQFKASVQGTVTDTAGAVVSGAKITATNQETGVSSETLSNETGFYRIAGLAPGNYKISVEASSFRKNEITNVAVAAEKPAGVDVTLKPGAVAESITVQGDTVPGVQTESANVGGNISEGEVKNLPQFGRDPYELLRTVPGVFGDSSRVGNGGKLTLPSQQGPGGSNAEIFQTENQVQVSANGQRVSSNSYQVDGVSANSLGWGGAAVITPAEETVKELVVVTNSYSAEDGRNAGALVNVISQQGTNTIHGTGFVKFNDKGLNAYNKYEGPFGGPQRANQKYRDFGGSVGGPVVKNKLFFFFAYEGLRSNNTSVAINQLVETPEFRQYAITQRPNSLAALIFNKPGIAPRIQQVLGTPGDCCSLNQPSGFYYDASNATGGGPAGIPEFEHANILQPTTSNGGQYNGRLDYTRGKDQFFGSVYLTQRTDIGGGQRPIQDVNTAPTNSLLTLGWAHTLSSTTLNELRGNFTRWDFNQVSSSPETNYGIPQVNVFDFDSGMGCCFTIGVTRSGNIPGILVQNTFEVRDTLSKVVGRHALKFGVQVAKNQNNNNEGGAARPQYQYDKLLNFLNNAPQLEGITVNPITGAQYNGQRYFRTSYVAGFVQDDLKFRHNLTLNLGLRYEYFSPLNEKDNQLSNYVLGAASQFDPLGITNGKVVNGIPLYEPDHRSFAPRVGFAWAPEKFRDRVAVRGGFGINYNRIYDSLLDGVRFNTPFAGDAFICCIDTNNNSGTGIPFFQGQPIAGPGAVGVTEVIGSSNSPYSYPANPGLAFGIDPATGGLCANKACTSDVGVTIWGSRPSLPNPYVYNFSLDVQWEVAKNWVTSLGYKGSIAHKLIRVVDLNRLMPGDTFDGIQDFVQNDGSNGLPCGAGNPSCSAVHATGNKNFGRIFFPLPDVNSNYNALVAHVAHRMSHGLMFSANYTWAHSLDSASFEIGPQQTDPSNQSLLYASSDFDVRQNFVAQVVWDLPILRTRHDFLGKALGGWSLSSIFDKHTGFPWTPVIFGDTNNDPNGDGFRPDLPHEFIGPLPSSPTKQQFVSGLFPVAAGQNPGVVYFGMPTGTTTADRGAPPRGFRNFLPGPGYSSIDLSASKKFGLPNTRVLGEGAAVEFRSNFFNLFNILNLQPFGFSTSQDDLSNAFAFGKVPGALAGRVIEFQVRLSF
jgi:hypothetical protein